MDNKEKQKTWEIIESCCENYGGFINVINNCGGTLVSQIWIKSMQEHTNLHLDKFAEDVKNMPMIDNERINELLRSIKTI